MTLSPAVAAQRVEAQDSLDDFPTPPWATRALMEHVLPVPLIRKAMIQEPCCNRGYMARPLTEYARRVYATDIFDYGWSGMSALGDFLFPGAVEPPEQPDWVIANPPFKLGAQFVHRGLAVARRGVAMLVRSQFIEGGGRYRKIYLPCAPTKMAQFAERVIIHKGIVRNPDMLYLDEKTGKMKKPSTATAYMWQVWIKGAAREPMQWIPPCRRKMERPGDYAQLPVWEPAT